MEYLLKDIIERFNRNDDLSFLFFFGHQPKSNGGISNGCFSQWWPSTFIVDGIRYNCAEQYMMAEKARAFPGNEELINLIMKETDPRKHKQYGRQVKNYDDKVWSSIRKSVVLKGNIAKFSQNKELKHYLLNTGNTILVEASPYDAIWGIKMKKDDFGIENPNNWKGTNLLGFVLMEVRDILKDI